LVRYLEKYDERSKADKLIEALSDEEYCTRGKLIESLSSGGHCVGFTVIWLYAKWLSTQPKSEPPKPRDDYDWLKKTLTSIDNWDGESNLESTQQQDFDRLIYHIEYFQNIKKYQPTLSQISLTESLTDTKNRKLKKEYSLAASFTQKELAEILPAIIRKNKWVRLDSHNHAMGILTEGDAVYFYDSNEKNVEGGEGGEIGIRFSLLDDSWANDLAKKFFAQANLPNTIFLLL